jgi:hypothetical protein
MPSTQTSLHTTWINKEFRKKYTAERDIDDQQLAAGLIAIINVIRREAKKHNPHPAYTIAKQRMEFSPTGVYYINAEDLVALVRDRKLPIECLAPHDDVMQLVDYLEAHYE